MFIVTKLARQYEGELVFVQVLGAFHKRENMEEFVKGQKLQYGEKINGVDCVVELGVYENVAFLDQE